MNNLCFIDIETTGTIFDFHEIIDIAAITTTPDARTILNTVSKRLKPYHPERITETARRINEFRPADWFNAEESNRKFWKELTQFWSRCVPVCHNPSFERAFITLAAFRQGVQDLSLDYHWIGTESLAWPFYIEGYICKLSLSAISKYLGLEPEPIPHTAMNGARMCREVYIALLAMYQALPNKIIERTRDHVRDIS